MQDRIPLYPGRVKLIPVNGQANTFDMVRADEPTEAGTPLNKANLLADATAALCGLGEDAVPNDAFRVLGRFNSGLVKEHNWAKRVRVPYYVFEKSGISAFGSQTNCYFWPGAVLTFCTAWELDEATGEFVFENPIVITVEATAECAAALNSALATSELIYAPHNLTGSSTYRFDVYPEAGPNWFLDITGTFYNNETNIRAYITCSRYQVTISEKERIKTVEYLNAPDAEAYPPAEPDGFIYEYLGTIGEKSNSELVTWEGTGTYGKDNPSMINFSFTPKAVLVGFGHNKSITSTGSYAVWVCPAALNAEGYVGYSSAQYWKVEDDGKTLVWYGTGASYQLNQTGYTYAAVAFS